MRFSGVTIKNLNPVPALHESRHTSLVVVYYSGSTLRKNYIEYRK